MEQRSPACEIFWLSTLLLLANLALAQPPPEPSIDVWQGDHQRIGHLGDAQNDFNVLGHVEPWDEIDTLMWSLNKSTPAPLAFRPFRRIARDGDFNVDIPIALLKPGANNLALTLRLRDGRSLVRTVTIAKETGSTALPRTIRWNEVKNPVDVGQPVDGRWVLTPDGLRCTELGYDRLFLIGERTWRDYEVRTTIMIHAVDTVEANSGAAVGILMRFTGHLMGGPLNFPSGQPQWGYKPFGAICWLAWRKGENVPPPTPQILAGDTRPRISGEPFAVRSGETYAIRAVCRTLPDTADGQGVTRYQFKLWPAAETEPAAWGAESTQASSIALRTGGVSLIAHHVDVTFGDVSITPPTRE